MKHKKSRLGASYSSRHCFPSQEVIVDILKEIKTCIVCFPVAYKSYKKMAQKQKIKIRRHVFEAVYVLGYSL
jgi:hypothetical protein